MKITPLKLFSLCLVSLQSLFVWSNPIDVALARQYAEQSGLLKKGSARKDGAQRKTRRKEAQASKLQLAYTLLNDNDSAHEPLLYVFTPQSGQGYVIIAADDAVDPVAGYSPQAVFDGSFMPSQLKTVLRMMGQSVAEAAGSQKKMSQAKQRSETSTSNTLRQPIAPLLNDVKWGQGMPFNSMTPLIDSEHAVTGCVATALAQIMYHHRHPRQAHGNAYYKFDNFFKPGKNIVLGENGAYQWDMMHPQYAPDGSYTYEENNAVGLLLYEIGAACRMQYSLAMSSSSGANALKALHQNFDYPEAQLVRRMNKSAQEWEDIIYNELASNRPVYLDAVAAESGHAFVCDGYDGKGYYHINWGWNGQADGFFKFSLLAPQTRGIGGGGIGAFVVDLQAIIGIAPAGSISKQQPDYIFLAKALTKTSDYTDAYPKFDIRGLRLESYEETEAQFSLGIRDEKGNIINVGQPSAWSIAKEFTYNKIEVRLLPERIPQGSFTLFPIFSPKGQNIWQEIPVGRYFNSAVTVSNANGRFSSEEEKSTPKLAVEADKQYLFAGKKNTLTFTLTNLGETAYSSYVSVYFSLEQPDKTQPLAKDLVKKRTMSIHLEPGESQQYVAEYTPPTGQEQCFASITYDATNGLSDEATIIPSDILGTQSLLLRDAVLYEAALTAGFDSAGYQSYKDQPLHVTINMESMASGSYKGSFAYLQLHVMSEDKREIVHKFKEFEVLLEKNTQEAVIAGGEVYLDEGDYNLVLTRNDRSGNSIVYSTLAEVPLKVLPKPITPDPTTTIADTRQADAPLGFTLRDGLLRLSDSSGIDAITVHDMSGRRVAAATSVSSISLAHLCNGTYAVSVTAGKRRSTFKIALCR